MTTAHSTGDPVAAFLDQLAAHAEHITRMDASLTGLTGRLDAVAALAAVLDTRLSELAELLAGHDTPDSRDGRQAGYQPPPARRWWQLAGEDREEAVGVLRGWVEQVFRPGYGQLAVTLEPCWEQHPLCLYAVDILAELWSVLYLSPTRTAAIVSAQAEYQARILPALACQMTGETTTCHHATAAAPRSTP